MPFIAIDRATRDALVCAVRDVDERTGKVRRTLYERALLLTETTDGCFAALEAMFVSKEWLGTREHGRFEIAEVFAEELAKIKGYYEVTATWDGTMKGGV